MHSLEGRTVLITGAALGIGRSLAIALAKARAALVLVDIAADALASTASSIEKFGGRVLVKATDVTDADSVAALREESRHAFGGVDVLVNNAAIGPHVVSPRYLIDKPKFWTISDDIWLGMLRVNVFGPQLMTRHFVVDMLKRGWGRIVNITTSLDTMYRSGTGGYGPCKAALEAATRIMAQDLADTGVTANVLVPGGPVNTRMVPEESGFSKDELIQPGQMNDPLLWLCSDESNGINGIRIVARKWRVDQPLERRLAEATAPVAWPQLGSQSEFPGAAAS